jgi:glyoxylase-like metal-dependent hydrolase (beta-lactamase superfamily II)
MRLHQDDPTADWTVPGVYEVDVGLYRIPLPLEHDSSLWADPDDWLDAPDEIKLDSMTWQMHPTPGHTRGHVVFVDPGRDVMFAGDHVLPHITPSIGSEQSHAELPLGDYLDSLRLVRALPDRRLPPAHGPVSPSVHARADELLDHHDTRLRQIEELVDRQSGTAAEVAHRLRWTRRKRRFDELDLFNRSLAVSETLAHLDVLAVAGRLRRTDIDGTSHYASA